MNPRVGPLLTAGGMIGRIYVGYYYTLLHANYTSCTSCGFRVEDVSHYKPMADIYTPGAWSVWTPWSQLSGFIKGLPNIATYKI